MNVSELVPANIQTQLSLPLLLQGADYFSTVTEEESDEGIDLHQLLIRNPEKTLYVRAEGDILHGQGITDGDLLVVDRGPKPHHGDIVLACLDDVVLCRKLDLKANCLTVSLSSGEGKDETPDILFNEHANLVIEGVVRHVIRSL
ncbi:MAG: hypothetical protein K6L73_06195 [Cellvibrionaceae bacterium]